MIIYKIMAKDGRFSTGGSTPRWSKTGKVWKQRGHVSSHFTNLDGEGRRTYRDAEAVVCEYVITEEQTSTTPTSEWVSASRERAADRKAAELKYIQDRDRARRLAEYERLKKEFQ